MKNLQTRLIRCVSLLLLQAGGTLFSAQAQTLGGIPDKTFNVADSGGSVVPLNRKNQIFYPGPNAGVYVTGYDNFGFSNKPGRHLQTQTGYFDKEGVSNYQSIYANYSGNKSGDILTVSPGVYYSVQNWFSGNQIYGNDTLTIAKVSTAKNPPAIHAHKFHFNKPMRGFYNTGLSQTAPNRLAFWLTRNLDDTLKPHNVTYVRSLDTSCAPLAAFNEIPGFRAEISTAFQGNIYLLGHNMNDTLPTTTRIVVLDGITLQPAAVSLPGLAANDFLTGKPQIFRILPNGKMQIAGVVFNGQFSMDQVIQLNSDGSLDGSFPLSLSSGISGVRWSIDAAGTIRCGSNRVVSGVNMAVLGTLQPTGGIQSSTFPIPNEYGVCHPLMFHPDYNAFLFETCDLRPPHIQPYTSAGSYYSDTLPSSRHRFYVGYSGQTWPLVNKAGIGMFTETIMIDVNPVANKFVAYGDFTQVNKKLMPNLAVLNADGTLDPTFLSSLNITTDSIRAHMAFGGTRANLTNSGKVLLSYGPGIYNFGYSTHPLYADSTRRLLQNGLPDTSYPAVWHVGTLTRTKSGGFMSVRLYKNGLPVSLPNSDFANTIKIVKFDAEGNVLGELGSHTSNGSFPDTTLNSSYRYTDVYCEDEAGGAWIYNQVTGYPNNFFRLYFVRFDPNGTSRVIYPEGYSFRSIPIKIEILAGKRMRLTGAFLMNDSTLNGKIVNVIETDSTGKLDTSVPTKVFFVPDAFGGRQKLFACPVLYQSDGKMITLLKLIAADLGQVYIRLKADGKQDNSFMPIRGHFYLNYGNYHGILGDRFLIGVNNLNWAGYQYTPRISFFGTTFKNGVLAFNLHATPANTGYVQGRVTQVVSPAVGCNPTSTQHSARGVFIKSGVNKPIALTDTGGYYLLALDTGHHAISQNIQNNFLERQVCPTPPTAGYNVHLPSSGSASLGNDFINQTFDCPRLDLKILEPRFRLCSRTMMQLQYQNDGVAAQPNARIRINLSEEVKILSANRPFTKDSDSSYVFDLGTLQAGHHGVIIMEDSIGCPAQPDSMARACYSARIEPLSLCSNIDPATLLWDGAWLDAVARYNPGLNKVRVVIYNKGTSMADSSTLKLVGPGVWYRNGKFKLAAGDSLVTLCDPAIQGSIQLQLQQTVACPLGSTSSLFHSGRGLARSFLNFGSGLLETYTVQACPTFRFSWDPNEKLVQPEGNIEPGTELDYTIHFENYGNDTAYAVTVEDTLPSGLDVSTLKLGASSDKYELNIVGTENSPVLYFNFREIKLTGKKQDSIRSKGQLSFKIKTKADVARGSVISNRAHIYFDRNEAVTTEFVHSPIAQLGSVLENKQAQKSENRMILAPNPARGSAKIWFTQVKAGKAQTVRISTVDGKQVEELTAFNGQAEVKGLSPGIYIVTSEGVKPQRLIVIE